VSKERLQEIKTDIENWNDMNWNYSDIKWLISEVERLQAENETFSKQNKKAFEMYYKKKDELTESQHKVERLESLIKRIETGYRGSREDLDEVLDDLFFGGKNGLQALESEGKE
jgi:cell fate (sporulation/competence/biofilm development) regulator YmcA (YheA/YmcA/DUF963 family)